MASAHAGSIVGCLVKKHNSSPQRTPRTPRKKILYNLCDLRDLCGEIFLENVIGYFEVSYKVSGTAFPVSAQPLVAEGAGLIENETFLEPKKI